MGGIIAAGVTQKLLIARGTGTIDVASGAAQSNKINALFDTVVLDTGGWVQNGKFVAPGPGVVRASAQLIVTNNHGANTDIMKGYAQWMAGNPAAALVYGKADFDFNPIRSLNFNAHALPTVAVIVAEGDIIDLKISGTVTGTSPDVTFQGASLLLEYLGNQ